MRSPSPAPAARQEETDALAGELAQTKRKSAECAARLAEEKQRECGALQSALAKAQAEAHDLRAELARGKAVEQDIRRAHEAEVAELMDKVATSSWHELPSVVVKVCCSLYHRYLRFDVTIYIASFSYIQPGCDERKTTLDQYTTRGPRFEYPNAVRS